jgi:hypothetical protein
MTLAKEMVAAGFSPGQAQGAGGGNATVAAAGTNQATGTVINGSNNIVTGANGTTGVTLLAAQPGDEIWIFNNSGSTLKVWPPVGAAIAVPGTGLGTANASFSQLTYKTTIYKCISATQRIPLTTA